MSAWGPGDFGTPEYINWSKWKRRGWLGMAIAALLGGGYALYWVVKNMVVVNWPG